MSARPSGGDTPTAPDPRSRAVRLEVPKTAGHEAPFYPQALDGRRSCRAVMLAVAEMYIKGDP